MEAHEAKKLLLKEGAKQFALLARDPDMAFRDMQRRLGNNAGKELFSRMCALLRRFHILAPLDGEEPLRLFVHRLHISGFKVAGDVLSRGSAFYTCTCPTCMHYGLCVHVCAGAFKSGALCGYPPDLDPTRPSSKKRGRRPLPKTEEKKKKKNKLRPGPARRSRRGGALHEDRSESE